ncbi:hypothetical protein [Rhodanobacter sp. BL-MT-08]
MSQINLVKPLVAPEYRYSIYRGDSIVYDLIRSVNCGHARNDFQRCKLIVVHTSAAKEAVLFETDDIQIREADYIFVVCATIDNDNPFPAYERDEAIRSGSIVASALITAVVEHGLVSQRVLHLDDVGIAQALGMEAADVVVTLVTARFISEVELAGSFSDDYEPKADIVWFA